MVFRKHATRFLRMFETLIRKPSELPHSIRRPLFLQYDLPLGSAIHELPVYEALKTLDSGIEISVACSGVNEALLRRNPFIDRVIPTPSPYLHPVKAGLYLRAQMKRNGLSPDAILSGTGSARIKVALTAMIASNARRMGYSTSDRLYDEVLSYDPKLSVIENNLRLLTFFGNGSPHLEPKLYLDAHDDATVRSMALAEGVDPRKKIAVFATQTSGGQPTDWRGERFAEVADSLFRDRGLQIVFVGTGEERPRIDRIRKRMQNKSVSLAGKTSVGELIAFLSKCHLAVCVDTGTLHILRALKVPTVAIVSSWQPKHEWLPPHPLKNLHIIRREEELCPKCGKTFCTELACMDLIPVEDVISACAQMLDLSPNTDGPVDE